MSVLSKMVLSHKKKSYPILRIYVSIVISIHSYAFTQLKDQPDLQMFITITSAL